MRLLGPTSLTITFQKISLKDVLQNTCVYLSLYNCLVLTGTLRTPLVLTGLPGLPWDFPPSLPMGPGPYFSSAWGHQSLLQRHHNWPAPARLDWSCLDLLDSPWLATWCSQDCWQRPLPSPCCPAHPPRRRGAHPVHRGIAQPAWWLLPAPPPLGSSPALAARWQL